MVKQCYRNRNMDTITKSCNESTTDPTNPGTNGHHTVISRA